jgi:hypothetical protein
MPKILGISGIECSDRLVLGWEVPEILWGSSAKAACRGPWYNPRSAACTWFVPFLVDLQAAINRYLADHNTDTKPVI